MNEIWKDIDGYNGKYQISNFGNVRIPSYIDKKNRFHNERIFKHQKNQEGYHTVCLTKNRVQKRFLVHRLVATYFIENPENLLYVNHKDEDKDNNCVHNLEWCTRQYNLSYGTRVKRASGKRKKPVLQFDKEMNFIREWDSARDVERELGFSNSNINACCLKKPHHKTQYGYIWRYKKR